MGVRPSATADRRRVVGRRSVPADGQTGAMGGIVDGYQAAVSRRVPGQQAAPRASEARLRPRGGWPWCDQRSGTTLSKKVNPPPSTPPRPERRSSVHNQPSLLWSIGCGWCIGRIRVHQAPVGHPPIGDSADAAPGTVTATSAPAARARVTRRFIETPSICFSWLFALSATCSPVDMDRDEFASQVPYVKLPRDGRCEEALEGCQPSIAVVLPTLPRCPRCRSSGTRRRWGRRRGRAIPAAVRRSASARRGSCASSPQRRGRRRTPRPVCGCGPWR